MDPTIQKWFQNPEFNQLPNDRKLSIVGRYFGNAYADKEFFGLPDDHKESVFRNFISENVPKPPGEPEDGWLETAGKAGMRGMLGIGAGVGAITEFVGDVTTTPGISEAGKTASDFYKKQIQEGPFSADPQTFGGSFLENPSFKRAFGHIAEAIPSMGTAMIASIATGNPFVGAGFLGAIEGFPEYQEAKERGIEFGDASKIAITSALGTAMLEYIPISRILKRTGGVGVGFLKSAAEEGLQEGSQTIWQNFIAKIGYDKTRNLVEGIVESMIGGAGAGGMVGGATARYNQAVSDARASGATDAEIQSVVKDTLNQAQEVAAEIGEKDKPPPTKEQDVRDKMATVKETEKAAGTFSDEADEARKTVIDAKLEPEKVVGPPSFVPERIAPERPPVEESLGHGPMVEPIVEQPPDALQVAARQRQRVIDNTYLPAEEEADRINLARLGPAIEEDPFEPAKIIKKAPETPESIAKELGLEFIGESDGVSTFRRVVDGKETTTSVQGDVSRKSLESAIAVQDKELADFKEKFPKREPLKTDEPYQAAKDTVDGRIVRAEIPNQDSIDSSIDDPEILEGVREVPMSDFELTGKHYSPAGNKRIDELADEIKASGEINPLIVVVDSEGSYILEGATRADALYRLGAKSFPAMVVIDKSAPTAKVEKPTHSTKAADVAGEVGGVEKGFDPLSILMAPPTKEEVTAKEKETQARTDAAAAVDAHIQKLKGDIEDWSSRVYKKNKTVVGVGGTKDDLNAGLTSAGAANERRRNRRIKDFKQEIFALETAKKRIANGEDLKAVSDSLEDDGFIFDLTKAPEPTITDEVIPEVDPNTLKDYTISQKMKVEETGKVVTVKVTAKEAYREAAERKSVYDKFLECLAS